jgi:hypothetical protein
MLDQVIVSGSVIEAEKGLCADADALEIFSPDFLLTADDSFPGDKPYSTYNGFKWSGGYSDHLPLMLKLRLVNASR